MASKDNWKTIQAVTQKKNNQAVISRNFFLGSVAKGKRDINRRFKYNLAISMKKESFSFCESRNASLDSAQSMDRNRRGPRITGHDWRPLRRSV